MNKVLYPVFFFLILNTVGCLVVEKIGYSIELNGDGSGKAMVTFTDIRSDAIGNNEFEEDKELLFNYVLKSSELQSSMMSEGKDIISRELIEDKGKLIGKVSYGFKDITKVEGLRKESGIIYLTMQVEDSLLSTNGEIIITEEYKRILWDEKVKLLEFEILSAETEKVTKTLAPFYKK